MISAFVNAKYLHFSSVCQVEDNFKIHAYALILLRGYGYPWVSLLQYSSMLNISHSCVFYGDLYPNRECFNESISKDLILLIEARKLFAYGQTEDYFADKNCIGFVRMGDGTHSGCAVLMSNRDR